MDDTEEFCKDYDPMIKCNKLEISCKVLFI